MFDPWSRLVDWGSGIAVSCGVSHRRGSDPALLWLWLRPVATALIGPLAWETPYAKGVALKRPQKKKSTYEDQLYFYALVINIYNTKFIYIIG